MDFDAVVIGSGAGGGFTAMALCERGLNVLVLERGRAFDPGQDYPMNFPDWETRPNPFHIRSPDPSIVRELGATLPAGTVDLCSRGAGLLGSGPCTHRAPFRYHRVFGVGGTTLHYQGEAHRFADYAFRTRTISGFGVDWPIQYRDLEPYYERAERTLGVAGDPANPFKPKRGAYPTPAHRLSPASQLIANAARSLGWSLLPNSLALPTRSVDGRSPCRRTGGCVQGCIYAAKSSVDVSALAHARRTGRLSLYSGARATQLESKDDRVTRVVYLHNGSHNFVEAPVVVLALGAVETPRLLLASPATGFANGLANNSGNVGRYFLDTIMVTVTARFAERLDGHKGPPIDARIWDFARPAAEAAVRAGYVLGVSGTLGGYHGPLSYMRRIPGIGLEHKSAMREQFGRIATVFGIAEQEPDPDNRITLSDRLDIDGVPMVHVRSAFSAADRAVTGEMLKRCKKLVQAADAREVLGIGSTYSDPSAAQVGGGCRMGNDRATSVTDPWGRAHELRNLFITDASVLPGQGAGDSPSLTIQALALRTADRIASLMKRHEL